MDMTDIWINGVFKYLGFAKNRSYLVGGFSRYPSEK
jgi:hypothetical protein